MKTTVAQSLKALKDARIYRYGVVETWNSFSGTRHDLFGFLDILAYRGRSLGLLLEAIGDWTAEGCLGVQTCAGARLSDHVNHYCLDPTLRDAVEDWLLAGNRFEIWGWAKKRPRNPDGSFETYKNGNRKPLCLVPNYRRFVMEDDELFLYENSELDLCANMKLMPFACDLPISYN